MTKWFVYVLGLALLVIVTGALLWAGHGDVHEVRMYNVHPEDPTRRNVFVPDFLVIEPGDRVRFVNVDGGHNSESIDNMYPGASEGTMMEPAETERWSGRISQSFEVRLSDIGIFGYKDAQYYMSSGMAGMIVVLDDGQWDPAIDEEIAYIEEYVTQKGKAIETFERLWAQVGALKAGD
ncbi:MAG: hypothetical protein AAGA50_04535 [Pseudomonadota bacterium]